MDTSEMEPVTVTTQKHDPAWKHCQMFKDGEKVRLKCIYCGKLFQGGGIHRIKEHLAGYKGNVATCPRVHPNVRLQMQESLKSVEAKKKKKQKLSEEILGYDNQGTSGSEAMNHGLNAEMDLLPVPEMMDHDSNVFGDGEDGVNSKMSGRQKKARVRKVPAPSNSTEIISTGFQNVNPLEVSNAVDITPRKRDPAWKHCQMFKNEDKVRLKCIYCGKIFKGGGIYRIKEHLAGQKGNGATCLRVQPHVRLEMQQCLKGIAVKARKKQKCVGEMLDYNNAGIIGDDMLNNDRSLDTEHNGLPGPEMLAHDSDVFSREDDMGNKSGSRRKAPNATQFSEVALTGFQDMNPTKASKTVHMAIGRFFVDVGLPVDAVNSAHFQPMIDAIISHGPGLAAPSYHDLRSSVLKSLVDEVKNNIDQWRSAWGRTGCSILVNECISGKGKTLVNFLVSCPEATIFLRSADISHATDSSNVLFELLRETVEEVGVRNVLQVITSSDDRYVVARNRLTDTYPTIFWSPCAGNYIDSMLEDIGQLPRVKMLIEYAKSVSRYIYTNGTVLNMMRRYTSGVDLVDPGITGAYTDFSTLKRMVNIRYNLQSMVTSDEWMESDYSKTSEGAVVSSCINDDSFWSSCNSITCLIDPLMRLLRIVCTDKRPAMGFVYAGVYRAKEAIKKELVNEEEYLEYWKIIDRRWELLRRHPLHAAGFYLNPRFFYSLEGDMHLPIRSLVYDCIEKLVPDIKIQDKIMKETASYYGSAGDFGRQMAVRARDTLLPAEWWLTYGGGCPNLARLAIRILSQRCSLVQHNLNKIPLEHMHERKNCLEHQRLGDLLFVQYNMSLKQMVLGDTHHQMVDPISYEKVDIVRDWVVGKELCSQGSGNADWMAVDPPSGNVMLLGAVPDDIDALGTGFHEYEIFDGFKDVSEENGDENIGG